MASSLQPAVTRHPREWFLFGRIFRNATAAFAFAVAGFPVTAARAEKLMFVSENLTIATYDVTGTNGPAMQGSRATLITGTAGVSGMAWNAGANALYALMPGAKSITAITLTGSLTTAVSPASWDAAGLGTGGFFSLAINNAGDMFFCDFTNGRIMKSTPQGVISAYATGLSNPANVTVDPTSGKVWFTEPFNNRIGSIDGGSITFSTITSPRGIVFDSVGIGYIIQDTNQITKMLSNGTMSTFATFPGAGTANIGRDDTDRIYALVRSDPMLFQPNTMRLYSPSGSEITSFTTPSPDFAVPTVPVPEPSAYATALAGLACGGYSLLRRRRFR